MCSNFAWPARWEASDKAEAEKTRPEMQGSVTKAEANSTENATSVVITVAGEGSEGSAWLQTPIVLSPERSVPCCSSRRAAFTIAEYDVDGTVAPLALAILILASMGIYRGGAQTFLLRDNDTKIPCSSTSIQRQARLCVLYIQVCVMWCSVQYIRH